MLITSSFLAALELAKESKMNYGDEITYKIRLARKKRWNAMEEKRISEEIELQTYLSNLIKMDKENRFKTLWIDVENKKITDEQTIKNLEQNINSSYEQRMIAMNDLFQQVNEKRQVNNHLLLDYYLLIPPF